ncbi:MAG: hypothetical protein PHX21_02840 [bacterium]|nr:hypothetical protein [bacterium]
MKYKFVIICLLFLACNRKQFTNPNDLINTPPAPKLISPIGDTLMYNNPPILCWEAIDDTLYPSGGVYEILYSTDSNFTSPISITSEYSYVSSSTLFRERCFWKVRARREEASEKAWGEWSDVASFRERFPLVTQYKDIPGGEQIFISDDYAYIRGYRGDYSEANSFYILNLSNPTNPAIISSFTDSNVTCFNGMKKSGDYLFFLARDDSSHYVIRTYSIANPSSPTFSGSCRVNYDYYYNIFAISYPAVYVKNSSYYISIIDASQPTHPFVTDSIECQDNYSIRDIQTVGNYLLLFGQSKIYVYDISDPLHPSIANSYNCNSSINTLYISGDTLFTLDYNSYSYPQISIFDISALPTINNLENIYISSSSFSGQFLFSNNCFIADYGYYILELNGVNKPFTGRIHPSFSIYGMTANKDYLYLLSSYNGISIIKLCN